MTIIIIIPLLSPNINIKLSKIMINEINEIAKIYCPLIFSIGESIFNPLSISKFLIQLYLL